MSNDGNLNPSSTSLSPEAMIYRAAETGDVRLEVVDGLTVWEAFPSFRHQERIFDIQRSIAPVADAGGGCGCVHAADILVRFPDGSVKRPDIAIFCNRPREMTSAVTMLPEAVIEILSPGYEGKDLSVGVPFYLRQQIKDILVLDPENGDVRHFRPGQSEARHTSPVTLTLACGCEVTV
jgi:Uma2 family endonuclease